MKRGTYGSDGVKSLTQTSQYKKPNAHSGITFI